MPHFVAHLAHSSGNAEPDAKNGFCNLPAFPTIARAKKLGAKTGRSGSERSSGASFLCDREIPQGVEYEYQSAGIGAALFGRRSDGSAAARRRGAGAQPRW